MPRPKKKYLSPFKTLKELEDYPVNPRVDPSSKTALNRFKALTALFPPELLPPSPNKFTKAIRESLIAYTNANTAEPKKLRARWNAILYLDGFKDIELDSDTFLPRDSALVNDISDLERRMSYGRGYHFAVEVDEWINTNEINGLFARDVAHLVAKHYSIRDIASITGFSKSKVSRELSKLKKSILKSKHNLYP